MDAPKAKDALASRRLAKVTRDSSHLGDCGGVQGIAGDAWDKRRWNWNIAGTVVGDYLAYLDVAIAGEIHRSQGAIFGH